MGAPVYVENQVIAMKANGAVTANRVVKADTTEGQVLHTTAITEPVFGVALNPAEADPPLVIDPDAVLSLPVPFQGFQTVARRLAQGVEGNSRCQHRQFALCRADQIRRKPLRRFPLQDLFRQF